MKWIGQHIWDFISRFRSTVYLEDLDTSSEQNVLVVDSDGKVTKNTSLGGDDLTIANASDNRVVTSTGGTGLEAESTLTYDPSVTQEYFQPFEPDYDNGLLTIGAANNSAWDMGPTITTADATSGNKAKGLRLRSGASSGTNKSGAPVTITSGIGTGSSQPNILDVEGPNIGSSGTTANDPVPTLRVWKAVNGTYGKSTILDIFDPGGTDIGLNKLSFYVSDDADNCVIQARKHSGSAKLTLDVDGDIDINADGGDINFKDGANQLARITSNGLSFRDNLGAYIRFEGTTDDGNFTDLAVADPTGSRTITFPDATGTVALTSDITDVDVSVANLKTRLGSGFASNAVSIGDADDTVTIPGNLTVSGTTTTINTTNLNVEDKNITLNYGAGDTSGSADGAGITVQDAVNAATDASIVWDATDDKWNTTQPFFAKSLGTNRSELFMNYAGSASGEMLTLASNSLGGNKTITFPNATGTVALTSDRVKRLMSINPGSFGRYFYLQFGNTWMPTRTDFNLQYGTGAAPNLTTTGSTLAQQSKAPLIVATSDMKIYKVNFNWYWTAKSGSIQGTRNFEFSFHDATVLNDSIVEQTLSSPIVVTNNNGAFTNDKAYTTTWELAGGSGFTLSAGEALYMFTRCTSFSSGSTLFLSIAGNMHLEYEYV